jgi:hypothetical protein
MSFNTKKSMKTLTKTHSMKKLLRPLLLLLMLFVFAQDSKAQSALPIERKDVTLALPSEQRKYAVNMPQGYVVIDLVNYPTGRDEDKYRQPGLEYVTVDDFYNVMTPYQKLQVLHNPTIYMVALDASDFPTMTVGQ